MYNTTQPLPLFTHSGEPHYNNYGIIILIVWIRTIIALPSTFIKHQVVCQLFLVSYFHFSLSLKLSKT